ncbi:hypothetical protein [Paenibacillus thermotolerans]|uniref:hypothetical protein n=1 Tax=Paenibacillus thermotolerans TaxID=3027807 RepID=UPI00236842AE|nr:MULTISPECIES: hypothetical protein [unclassified Paenibacillus]
MNSIAIGPIVITYSLMYTALSVLAGYLAVRLQLRNTPQKDRKAVLDSLITAFSVGLLVWKFSPAIFDFSIIREHVSSLLYFNGGTRGSYLAGLVVCVILAVQSRKLRKPIFYFPELLLLGYLAGTAVHGVLWFFREQGGVPALGTTILAVMILILHIRQQPRQIGAPYPLFVTLLWLSLGRALIAFVGPEGDSAWFVFSVGQTFWLSMALLSFMVKVLLEKKQTKSA